MARFAELARPLFAKVIEGVYRELLLARLAKVIGLAPQRLEQLWDAASEGGAGGGGAGSGHGGGHGGASASGVPQRPKQGQSRTSAGRWSLIRQAIAQLVWFPAIAQTVTDAERAGLNSCEEPGIDLLRELLDNLRAEPLQISAQVIERWADKPEGEHLAKLLQREELVADAGAAASELKAALVRLADMAEARRQQVLEAKSRQGPLTREEMEEFQRLIVRKTPRGVQ